MKSHFKERLLKTLAIPLLVVVLAVLAVMQYRWSNQVSIATRSQIQANLQTALMGVRTDLNRELVDAPMELKPVLDSGSTDAAQLAQVLRHWQDTASHPALLSHAYLLSDNKLLRLNSAKSEWESYAPDGRFQELMQIFANMRGPMRPPHGPEERHGPRPFGGGRPNSPWFVDARLPALVFLIHEPLRGPVHSPIRGDIHERAHGRNQAAREKTQWSPIWLIVELNTAVLRNEIFPELVQKYFSSSSGIEYHVAVLSGEKSAMLFASDNQASAANSAASDGTLNLFGPPIGSPGVPLPPDPMRGAHNEGASGTQFERLVRLEPLDRSPAGIWKIVAQHQRGSVEAAVAAMRRRNLAVSFGVLLLLATSMAIIIVTSRRAHHLAELQMDFVAGVSHELRTPLAVISSAAENMAHGVVTDKEQTIRYGNSILNQTRQLTHLVEQVLQFATVRQGRRKYDLQATSVQEAVSAALDSVAAVTRKAGVVVELDIAENIPHVAADLSALVQCLQNLITNAAKYGAGGHWMRISSAVLAENGRPVQVQISVSDKGMGIGRDELKHVFDPFYRSPAVAGSQIHGTGLGLPLTKAAVEAMGGRISAESEINQGSVFTISLPVWDDRVTRTEPSVQQFNAPAQDAAP